MARPRMRLIKPERRQQKQLALTFTDATSNAQLQAMLGPPWWWEENAIALSPGDLVELEGFQGEGHMELNWLQNLTTGVRIELRTAEGTPVWKR